MGDVIVWAGWVAGIAIGLYMLLQYWLAGEALGASTGFGNVCALGSKQPFFQTKKYADPVNWRLLFLIGIPLGGLIGLLTSGGSFVPNIDLGLYDAIYPSSVWGKGLILTGGGVMVGYGARMAGGCTSGHSITGMAMLNPPSLLASVGFFVGGIIVVQIMFRSLV
ncbi:MAG: putative membrane protein YedE/YeeE [Myxococcota bacterium]|jgi:uncharacterized membrane protein YedE/YeeE